MTEPREESGEVGVFTRQQGVVARRIADEVFLVPTTGKLANLQKIFVLDEVGEFVWELLDGERDLAAVSIRVTEEFSVGAERAEADIREFVAGLIEAGLVVESREGSESEGDGSRVQTDHR